MSNFWTIQDTWAWVTGMKLWNVISRSVPLAASFRNRNWTTKEAAQLMKRLKTQIIKIARVKGASRRGGAYGGMLNSHGRESWQHEERPFVFCALMLVPFLHNKTSPAISLMRLHTPQVASASQLTLFLACLPLNKRLFVTCLSRRSTFLSLYD